MGAVCVMPSHGRTVRPLASCIWKKVVPTNKPNTNTITANVNSVTSFMPASTPALVAAKPGNQHHRQVQARAPTHARAALALCLQSLPLTSKRHSGRKHQYPWVSGHHDAPARSEWAVNKHDIARHTSRTRQVQQLPPNTRDTAASSILCPPIPGVECTPRHGDIRSNRIREPSPPPAAKSAAAVA